MLRKAAQSMRDFEIKYNLHDSDITMQPADQPPASNALPVVQDGKVVGMATLPTTMMPQQVELQAPIKYAVSGFEPQPGPDVPVVPQVNTRDYSGLDSYFESAPPSLHERSLRMLEATQPQSMPVVISSLSDDSPAASPFTETVLPDAGF